MVDQCYRQGESLGGAFRRLLQEVLSGFEILFVDPMHPAMRDLAAPFLAEALRQAEDLSAAVEVRNRALEAAGYHAQVHWDRQTSFVFLLEDGRRQALKRNGSSYLLGARKLSADELIGRAGQLSPNALLRPVIQDAMLPTAAYVGGPAELAYLAQSEVLYSRLLGRMPVAIPRAGFTLFDARAAKLVKRYGLGSCPNPLADLLAGEDHVRARIAAKLAPPELAGSMAAARESTARALDRLATDLVAYDPTLAAALAKSRRKIEHQLERIEGRIGRETLRRDTRAAADARFLSNLVYPGKHLQERVYSVLPFLARFGLDLPARIYEHIQPGCADHQLAIL
ncbi:MAG: bacillithiol biosynthesis BshC [Bryobacterales bacterium]|nr:bacillithiol biosynthesis BshC [Bryobacterales bacterium]